MPVEDDEIQSRSTRDPHTRRLATVFYVQGAVTLIALALVVAVMFSVHVMSTDPTFRSPEEQQQIKTFVEQACGVVNPGAHHPSGPSKPGPGPAGPGVGSDSSEESPPNDNTTPTEPSGEGGGGNPPRHDPPRPDPDPRPTENPDPEPTCVQLPGGGQVCV